MNLAAIINGIGGFAGGLADALQQQQGQGELGDALSALYGGDQSSGGSSPMGGGAAPPPMIPMLPDSGSGQGGGQYQGRTNLGLPSATGMGAGPLTVQPPPAATAQPGTAQPGPPPAAMSGGNYGYAAPPPQSPPQGQNLGSPVGATQQAGSPPAGQSGGASSQIGRGPLSLPALVAAIKQRHPGISGAHLAMAVQRAIPLMNMEGLQQYRNLGLQLREEQMQNLQADRADRSADRKQGMRDRMQMSSDRIQEQSARHAEDIQLKLKSLSQSKSLKEARGYASDLRAAIKDKLEATNHQIQMQYNLTDDQKSQLYKQAQDDAKRANEQLDQLLSQKGKSGETGGKASSEDNKKDTQSSTPHVSAEQEQTLRQQAEDAMHAHKGEPGYKDKVIAKFKELTGKDLYGPAHMGTPSNPVIGQ